MECILQVALDFLNLSRAMKVAEEASSAGDVWLEAGTPLIKSEGLEAVRALRKAFPKAVLVADMKIMDTGRIETEMAAKSGANWVVVMGSASDATIKECIEAGRNYGAKVEVDLLEVSDPVARAKEVESWGADGVGVHLPIDQQMEGGEFLSLVRSVAGSVSIPVAVAGGINSETIVDAIEAGARVVIVGGAITKATDARKATEDLLCAMKTQTRVPTELFKRVDLSQIRDVFHRVSAANVADAMHRFGYLPGLSCVTPGVKLVGPVVTVRTAPGDWAKPVEAIECCQEGDVIAVDAGGVPPAVWGELATHSCQQKGLAGVVIDGALRDAEDIRKLGFPAFSRHIAPVAGEPKGFGEIGAPVTLCGVKVQPGDWMVGDSDGVVHIPREKLVGVANRAQGVLELENRLRREIRDGSTLSEVMELLRWEKK